jgi:hypothetical protein
MSLIWEPIREAINERGWKYLALQVLLCCGWVACVAVVALWMWVIQ